MRGIGDIKDRFKVDWLSLHAELVDYMGHIASYNGETITTAYMSTTGGLDIGATVDYVLRLASTHTAHAH